MEPLCIAHRGKHNVYFENTKEAFEAAAELNFYGIETDVRFTKDNRWVLNHNDFIVSGSRRYKIKKHCYDEITKMNIDNGQGHKEAVCGHLSEFLKICNDSGKRPVVEIKDSPKWKNIKSLISYIDRKTTDGNYTIIAFNPRPLMKIKLLYPEKIHMQLLIGKKHTKFHLFLASLFKWDVNIDYRLLTQNIMYPIRWTQQEKGIA